MRLFRDLRWVWVATVISVGLTLLWRDFSQFVYILQGYAEASKGPQLPDASEAINEAIVVLTGDKKRIPKAIELLRGRGSPWLIISGTGKGASLLDVVNNQGDAATHIHEHWNKIIVEARSQTTIDNTIESTRILNEKKINRVILVTSDYHMARSLKLFRYTNPGTEVIPYPVASGSFFWSEWPEYIKNRVIDIWGIDRLVPQGKF